MKKFEVRAPKTIPIVSAKLVESLIETILSKSTETADYRAETILCASSKPVENHAESIRIDCSYPLAIQILAIAALIALRRLRKQLDRFQNYRICVTFVCPQMLV